MSQNKIAAPTMATENGGSSKIIITDILPVPSSVDTEPKAFKFGQVDHKMLMSRLYSTPFQKTTTNQQYALDMGSTSVHKPRIKKLSGPPPMAEPIVRQMFFLMTMTLIFQHLIFIYRQSTRIVSASTVLASRVQQARVHSPPQQGNDGSSGSSGHRCRRRSGFGRSQAKKRARRIQSASASSPPPSSS